MRLARMYLRVVLKQAAHIILARDVVKHGVGHVERNIVDNIMTR
jgi:hypothetical protein